MRQYTIGDSGEAVRDIQGRLTALGLVHDPDSFGEYGHGTAAAVSMFQSHQGMETNGDVDDATWQALVEAGYQLGDRVLYHRRPMVRGGDVVELQQLLNDLGFDSGKADGVFGPLTAKAVLEFQENRGLGEDGIAGPRVMVELRSVQRASRKVGKEIIREREWLRHLPTTVVSARACFDSACRSPDETKYAWLAASRAAAHFRDLGGTPLLSRSASVPAPEDVRSRRANRLGSDLVVGFQLPRADRPGVFYFDSGRSTSPAGKAMADFVTVTTGLEAGGRSLPILRGTRAPAIVVSAPTLGDELAKAVVEGVASFFRKTAAEMSGPGTSTQADQTS